MEARQERKEEKFSSAGGGKYNSLCDLRGLLFKLISCPNHDHLAMDSTHEELITVRLPAID